MAARESGGIGPQAARGSGADLGWAIAWLVALLIGLAALSFYSYPVFHTVAELYCMIVAASIFIVVLHTRRLLDNHYLLFVGIGFLFFILLGFPHLLGYAGVRLIPGFDNDLPTQSFIVQRLLMASTFLIAPLFLTRRLRIAPAFAVYAAITCVALLSMLVWRDFPHMFVEGVGLTPLKKASELLLSVMFAASGYALVRHRASFDPKVLRVLLGALVCFTASEVFFSSYATPFGSSNLVGHLLQIVGFYLTYRAVLVTALVNPFGILFRELSERESENARLYEAEARRAERIALLKMIADSANASLEVPVVAESVVTAVGELFDAQQVQLRLLSGDRTSLEPAATVDLPGGYLRGMGPIAVDADVETAACFRSGRARMSESIDVEGIADGSRVNVESTGIRSYVLLPLNAGGEVIGTFYVAWTRPQSFSPETVAFFEAVAAQFVAGLQNARLFEAERMARARAGEELENTRLLLEAAKTLSSTTDLDEVLTRYAIAALEITGLSRAFVNLIDMERQVLTPAVATHGLVSPGGEVVPFERLSRTSRDAILAKKTTVLDYERPGTPDRDREIAESNNVRVALFVPLLVGDEIVGHIAVDESGVRHEFSSREIELVEAISSQAAIMVRNARLSEAARHHAEFDRVLADAAAVLASTFEIEQALPEVLRSAAGVLGAMGGLVAVAEPGGWRVSAADGVPSELVGEFFEDPAVPTLARVRETRESCFVPDVTEAEPTEREQAARLGYRSFVTHPVMFHDEAVAALTFLFASTREPLSEAERYVISRLAFIIGVSQENASMFRREHTIAETLQEALLALPDRIPGIEFAHVYRSATEASRVGGDFYDVFELSQNHIGVTIGDVSGKGLNAAVVTSLVKNTVRAHATERGKTPRQILSLTDEVVYNATPAEVFVTVFFGILDLRDGQFTYANAGHTTTAVVRADGGIVKLGVTGPLLGAFAGVEFGQAEVRLAPDDLLFLYTDGLTEARQGRQLFGEARLMEALRGSRGEPPEALVRSVMDEVGRYSGGTLRDDLAILAIRLLSLGVLGSGQLELPA